MDSRKRVINRYDIADIMTKICEHQEWFSESLTDLLHEEVLSVGVKAFAVEYLRDSLMQKQIQLLMHTDAAKIALQEQ